MLTTPTPTTLGKAKRYIRAMFCVFFFYFNLLIFLSTIFTLEREAKREVERRKHAVKDEVENDE